MLAIPAAEWNVKMLITLGERCHWTWVFWHRTETAGRLIQAFGGCRRRTRRTTCGPISTLSKSAKRMGRPTLTVRDRLGQKWRAAPSRDPIRYNQPAKCCATSDRHSHIPHQQSKIGIVAIPDCATPAQSGSLVLGTPSLIVVLITS